MPSDLTLQDLMALAWCFAAWTLHSRLVDHGLFGAVSLNLHMHAVRIAWMRNMIGRDNRMMDSMLLGHLIQSVSFFASTTVLLLAGLIGALAAADQGHRLVMDLGVTVPTSRALFELKLLLIIGILIWAFFSFTWSLRQFNYTIAILGAVPASPHPGREALAEEAASVMSLAVRSFNAGLRCYYFAFAVLGWFIGPLTFAIGVAAVILVLLRRQYGSEAARRVQRFARAVCVDCPETTGEAAQPR